MGIACPCYALPAKSFDDLVDESDLRVENTPPPYDCRGDHRRHARQEYDHPEEAPGLVALHLADQRRDGKRNHYVKSNCDDGEYDRVLERFDGVRIVEQFSVVVKSNKLRRMVQRIVIHKGYP